MAGGNERHALLNGGTTRMNQSTRRCSLAVFAHPDDETSAAAGTLTKYAREGVDIHVVTATRGERGGLGTGNSASDGVIYRPGARRDRPPGSPPNGATHPSPWAYH